MKVSHFKGGKLVSTNYNLIESKFCYLSAEDIIEVKYSLGDIDIKVLKELIHVCDKLYDMVYYNDYINSSSITFLSIIIDYNSGLLKKLNLLLSIERLIKILYTFEFIVLDRYLQECHKIAKKIKDSCERVL